MSAPVRTFLVGLTLVTAALCPSLAQQPPGPVACDATQCDDGNPCTDDLCDPNFGCLHAYNNAPCSDGNPCTAGDACNRGVCVGGNSAAGCRACQAVADIPSQGGIFVGAPSGPSTLASNCGQTNLSPERVYRWTPSSSGVATIQTCGPGTNYDTVLYLSGSCGGRQLACNDDAPCAVSGLSGQGSRLTPTVTAGQTYYIVVDGYHGHNGTYTLTVSPPAVCGNNVREGDEQCDGADAAACAGRPCTAACTCAVPATGLPDLVPDIFSVSLDFGATVSAADVAEGCARATSGVDLLRFALRSRNVGTADFVLGDPGCPEPCSDHPLAVCANPEFMCSPATGHNHPHYTSYARYELLDPGNQVVVVGRKQGFCMDDANCAQPKFTCEDQGLSVGCEDIYGPALGCQYLDVTDVPSGTYTLRATLDPFDRVAELDESNNVATVPVTISRSSGGSGTCTAPTALPAGGGTFTGTTSGTSALTGSCGNSSTSPEQVFVWTPDASGTATIETCSTSATSYDTVLYVRRAACSPGAEVGCNDDTAGCGIGPDGSNPHRGSRLQPTVTAGDTYFIVVDGYGGALGSFQLRVAPASGNTTTTTTLPGGACGSPIVVSAAGGVFTGTTSGPSTESGSCGNTSSSPEQVYQWTPASSGTATIETCSASATTFDTVLYLRQGTCSAGTESTCNDDTRGCGIVPDGTNPHRGSRLTPSVSAGQTYFIVVDGYLGASGSYQLRVVPPG